MRYVLALIAGGLFGAGLFLSGMTDATKVQGWLDIFGDWDPTLAFVMGGAILPMMVAWRLTRTRRPLIGGDFPAPAAPLIDRRLLGGSVAFGAGWGLAGLCPGPALASLSYGGVGGIVFLIAMLVGMGAAPRFGRSLDRAPRPT